MSRPIIVTMACAVALRKVRGFGAAGIKALTPEMERKRRFRLNTTIPPLGGPTRPKTASLFFEGPMMSGRRLALRFLPSSG